MRVLPDRHLVRDPRQRQAAVPGVQGRAVLCRDSVSAAGLSTASLAAQGPARYLRDRVTGGWPAAVSFRLYLGREEERQELSDRRPASLSPVSYTHLRAHETR